MGYYRDFIDLCKRKIDARDLLDYYGVTQVIEQDDELIHSCLIENVDSHHAHGDAVPSASMNKTELLYTCGVYGGGSILWFIEQMEQTAHVSRAVEILKGFIRGTDDQPVEVIHQKIDALFANHDEPEPIPFYNNSVLAAWRYIHPYLIEDRGLDPRVLVSFGVGYDPTTNTIIVPHFWENKLVGWQRRKIDSPRWPQLPEAVYQPKWKSTPNFPKYQTLFNYDRINSSSVLVVEAPLSVIAWEGLRGNDLPPAVASFGSGVSETQAQLLRVFDEVTIYFDHDWAGHKGALRLLAMLINHVRCFIILDPPDGKDPAEVTYQEARELYAGAMVGVLAIPLLENKISTKLTKDNRA